MCPIFSDDGKELPPAVLRVLGLMTWRSTRTWEFPEDGRLQFDAFMEYDKINVHVQSTPQFFREKTESNKVLKHKCFQRNQSSQRIASSQTIITGSTARNANESCEKSDPRRYPRPLFQPRATPMRSSSGSLDNEAWTSLGAPVDISGSGSCHQDRDVPNCEI